MAFLCAVYGCSKKDIEGKKKQPQQLWKKGKTKQGFGGESRMPSKQVWYIYCCFSYESKTFLPCFIFSLTFYWIQIFVCIHLTSISPKIYKNSLSAAKRPNSPDFFIIYSGTFPAFLNVFDGVSSLLMLLYSTTPGSNYRSTRPAVVAVISYIRQHLLFRRWAGTVCSASALLACRRPRQPGIVGYEPHQDPSAKYVLEFVTESKIIYFPGELGYARLNRVGKVVRLGERGQ